MWGILAFFVLIVFVFFICFLYNNKKAFNIAKMIFCFLSALGFLILAIATEAYLFIGGTVIFIIGGIICAKNLDDDI